MRAVITLRLLGPVEVLRDGAPPPPELLWRKPLALLVYLRLGGSRPRGREHLMTLLWPDTGQLQARHSLNEALRLLRRSLGEAALESEGNQVRLASGVVTLDLDAFEGHARAGHWAQAAALVRGQLLQDFEVPEAAAFEEWMAAERAAWRQRSVEVLTRLAAQRLDAADSATALAAARAALALDPLAEAPHRVFLQVLALRGDRAAALAGHAEFAARFREALGADPGGDTNSLVERIRADRARPAIPTAAPAAPSRRTPLVGREGELAQLLKAWRGCREGRRATVAIVAGDPGVGKSRLLEEVANRARLEGALVATVRAVEADLAEPDGALLALARGTLATAPGAAGAPTAAVAALARRLPEWEQRFPAAGREHEGMALPAALQEVLRSVLEDQPAVVIVDDAQWVDRDSLLGLAAWLRDLSALPLFLLIGTTSPPARPELDAIQVRIPRDLAGAMIRLEPLGEPALGQLAGWALPRYIEADRARLTRRLLHDSAGLPLLAVELLHAVALGLDLEQEESVWPAPLRTLTHTLPGELPVAMVSAIRIGFRRLSAAGQRLLIAAAVLEVRVTPALLQRATGMSAGEVDAALDELEWQRWLVAEPRGYRFVARVAREVVAGDMVTAGQRERLRTAAADGA